MQTDKTAVTLTRQELYALVWKKPMLTLGKELGVSGNAIAKVCKKLNVPVPGRGHWMKLAHGKRTQRLPLPSRTADVPETATIDPRRNQVFPKISLISSIDGSVVAEPIKIPSDLRGCHPLISTTRRALEARKPGDTGLVYINEPGALKVTVSRQSTPRALRIMEALLRACLDRGWAVESSDKEATTRVSIGNDPVHFEIAEKTDRTEIEQPGRDKSDPWYRPHYKFNPNGQLVLQITDYFFDGTRRTWGDGKTQRLESKLPDFIAGLKITSDHLKKRRLQQEARHHQWEEEKRLREEQEARIKREKELRDGLFSEVKGWKKAAEIRALVAELRQRMLTDPARYDREAVALWSDWALGVALTADPFENGYFKGMAPRSPGPVDHPALFKS